MQQAVVSLWSLLEACRSGSDAEQCQAASAAAEAVHAHCCRQPGLDAGMILERAGAMLMVDGLPAVGGVDTFAASNGLLQFMRSAEVARWCSWVARLPRPLCAFGPVTSSLRLRRRVGLQASRWSCSGMCSLPTP